MLVNRRPALELLETGSVAASRTTHPALPDRLARPRRSRDRLVDLELVGRSPVHRLDNRILTRRYQRHLTISLILPSGFGQRHRWNQPHRIVGVVEDRVETRRVADAVPMLVVEPPWGLLLTLRRSLLVPPSPVTGGTEEALPLPTTPVPRRGVRAIARPAGAPAPRRDRR